MHSGMWNSTEKQNNAQSLTPQAQCQALFMRRGFPLKELAV